MNPFLNKSPVELKAMVPDLSDRWLDALATVVLGGKWGDAFRCKDGEPTVLIHDCVGILGPGTRCRSIEEYTSDGREATRLLVKYRLNVRWGEDYQYGVEYLSVSPGLDSDFCSIIKDADPINLFCRLITEQSVFAALQEVIEGDGE